MTPASAASISLSSPEPSLPLVRVEHGGLIRISPNRFHTAAELIEHFSKLPAKFETFRKRSKIVRVILDLRGGNVLGPEAGKIVQENTVRIYRSEDRLTILLDSQLVKLQTRRVVGGPSTQHFSSVADAENWLNEGL